MCTFNYTSILFVQFTWTHFPEHVIYFSLSVNHLKPLLFHWLFLKSRVLKTIAFKDDFYYLSFSIDCFYIYKYCSKFNTEFNKLIKTVGHHTRDFFSTNVEHTHLCQLHVFWLYLDSFIFSLTTIRAYRGARPGQWELGLSCNKTLKVLGL